MMDCTNIFQISRSDLSDLKSPDTASITDVKHLSSYNWIDAPTPTIAVPGNAPLWSDPKVPRQLKKDSGLVYIAQNAARHPDSPLEPLFRALHITDPSFDICSIDLVSDRNNLRKLLSFVDPSSNKHALEAFTISAELIENTVLFCRQEVKVEEYIGPNDFRGFGHEFEKAYTIASSRRSTGHHRIISYRLGNLHFMIRHETDGCIGSDSTIHIGERKPGDDGLAQMLKSMSLNQSAVPSGSKLTIREEGCVTPLESTLEIKTRVRHKPISIEEVAPQLWISQTPKLVRAYHVGGKFQVPQVEDVAPEIQRWEESNQKTLKILAALIAKVISVVKTHGRAVVKYDVRGDKLMIQKSEERRMLPEDLYSRWKGAESADSKADIASNHTQTTLPQDDITTKDAPNESETVIRIGDTAHSVPLHKIPYFASFVKAKGLEMPCESELQHDAIPLFDVALRGINSGYRQCFRLLDDDVHRYQTLCETYDFLQVDVLEGLTIDEVATGIKAGKTDFNLDYRGDKKLARDSAFKLVFFMLRDKLVEDNKHRNMLFNAVLYVSSHPGTFKYKSRKAVRAAYETRLVPSVKQKANLDKWKIDTDAEDDDCTTESDDLRFYDSDDDDYYWSNSS